MLLQLPRVPSVSLLLTRRLSQLSIPLFSSLAQVCFAVRSFSHTLSLFILTSRRWGYPPPSALSPRHPTSPFYARCTLGQPMDCRTFVRPFKRTAVTKIEHRPKVFSIEEAARWLSGGHLVPESGTEQRHVYLKSVSWYLQSEWRGHDVPCHLPR